MKGELFIRGARKCLLVLLVWCAGEAGEAYFERAREGVEPAYLAEWRALAAQHAGAELGVVCATRTSLTPLDRARLIAVNWECAAVPARATTIAGLSDEPPSRLLASRWLGDEQVAQLVAAGYRRSCENGSVTAWEREGTAAPAAVTPRRSSSLRTVAGSALAACLVVALALPAAGLRTFSTDAAACALLIFVLVAAATLSHGLLAPNGLGVQAGKGRLVLESRGLPRGFMTSPRLATYQPAYPPALSVLAGIAFALAGSWGDVAVQLLHPAAFAALALLAVADGDRPAVRLLTLVTLLSPLALRLASGFYAEPFAALCLAAGLRRATVVGDRRGWLIAGCAGLFRPEGLIIAAAYAWFAGGGGRRSRGRRLLMAAAPGLAWQAVVGCSGGGLEDFAFAAGPCLANVRSCVRVIGGYLTVRLAETGALPLAGLLLVPWRRLAVSLLLLILGGAAVSCTVSPHADWVVGETLPRFLWLVLVPQVIGLVTACSQKMNRPPLVSISDKPYNTRP